MTSPFLDMQAYIGISKHIGGIPATRMLLDLCHVDEAREVLDVGCGIGAGPVRIVREHDGRVVGVDVSEEMLAWARRRAEAARVQDRIDLVRADVLDLPFESDRFDIVMSESVLSFVVDKEAAIREMVRVTKPGGYVGLNEGFDLTATPSPRFVELVRSMGMDLITLDGWKALWEGSGLTDRTVRVYGIEEGREVRDRLRWVGLPWVARGIARGARLYLTDAAARTLFNSMFRAVVEKADDVDPAEAKAVWASLVYGLFVGRKP
jgi:SAM-dependent methyltransferase